MKHILSFDIAKGKSVYCFIDELKNTIIDATLIEHNKNEFDKLYNYNNPNDMVPIALLSTNFCFQRSFYKIYKELRECGSGG